jgi:hypothetical protein
MQRRLIIDSIRNDTERSNGNYSVQPRSARIASVFYGIATAGGTLAYQKLAPTREAADKLLDERLAAPFKADANDVLYQWTLLATAIRRLMSSTSRPQCSRSIRRTTSEIRRNRTSWTANSSA